MFKISLDAGHGLNTPGKRTPDNSLHEWQFNSEVVRYMQLELANYQDVAVLRVDDSTGQRDIPLKERTDRVNGWGSNIHISVHANAAGNGWSDAHGIETFVYKTTLKGSTALANKVQASLVSATGLTNRGVKAGDLHMVRETKMDAILVEGPFMTNQNEANLLKSDEFRRKYAIALVNGIANQFGLMKAYAAPVPQPAVPVQPTPNPVPQPAPTTRKVLLPANNPTWTVYKLGHPCVKSNPANIAGVLKPAKFGGLTYTILKDNGNGIYEIQTSNFGRVQIYAALSTGAKII
ncbi:MAG: N-acetylmuramoyl-L-alanine amidase family protein [Neobacillus sp.]|nr:N-acetylmuramoyl-L-alanine amidase family protein [Neobacillus sp.]